MRTVKRWTRFYAGGYNLSSEVGTIGPLKWDYDAELFAALDWEVKGGLPDQVSLGAGPVNGLFSQEAAGTLQAVCVPGVDRHVMVPIGFLAAPVMGDPVYCARLLETSGKLTPGTGLMTGSWTFAPSILAGLNYTKPWGVLLNALANRTAVNASAGVDGGAASSAGGYMAYQVMAGAGAGSVVIKVQDSADNATNWLDLASATISVASGAIPAAGQVAIPVTATVRRYLRWQIVFTGMTGVTFALAFVRG